MAELRSRPSTPRTRVASPRTARTCMRTRSRTCARSRSEEHTSELQSRLHLVCRLLLEKKKNTHEFQLSLHIVCRLLLEDNTTELQAQRNHICSFPIETN